MNKTVAFLFFWALLSSTGEACWFQTRTAAADKVVAFCKKHNFPVEKGCSKHDMNEAISKLPKAMAWVIKKADGPAAIMARCDLDGDGKITKEEIYMESDCLNACWKQIAIVSFM
jgi:hypothetical protein